MFNISADQTQWFHLYRVQKTYPMMFVLFCSAEVNDNGNISNVSISAWFGRPKHHGKLVVREE